MAYYCGECAVWAGSSDEDRYGRRWCSYSQKYEESNQNTYGCKGFVYHGRTVLTKVCELLHLPKDMWFEAFDDVKDTYVATNHIEWLSCYCSLGPEISKALNLDKCAETNAKRIFQQYLVPAFSLWKDGNKEQSANLYRKMVLDLKTYYDL